MPNIEQTREYPIDRQELFAYLSAPENWPAYDNGILEVSPFERDLHRSVDHIEDLVAAGLTR